MIYCVEDEAGIRELMLYTLNMAGFEAAGFPDGEAFWRAMDTAVPELILLDIMLPGEDGITILKKLHASPATSELPVIMTTAKGAEYDKVLALDLGADDYLCKPFGMMEMVSRIKAVLRRTGPKSAPTALQCGEIRLDSVRHTVTSGEREVKLTLKEYDLVKLMLESPSRVFTRENLLSAVWGSDFVGESRTVDVHIGTLRTKLGAAGAQIKTVRGVGYRLEETNE